MLDEVWDAACCGAGRKDEWLAVGHMRELLSFHAVILISECERYKTRGFNMYKSG